MLRGIKELVDLILMWGFWYVGSFMIMVVAIVYFIKSNPTPIINHHYSTVEVIEPPKRVLVEREVCKDIRGCVLLKGGGGIKFYSFFHCCPVNFYNILVTYRY